MGKTDVYKINSNKSESMIVRECEYVNGE